MTAQQKINILEIFRKINSATYSHYELNCLIEFSFSIAESYLRCVHKRVAKILLSSDISFTDAAIDAIADLFKPDETTNQFAILKSFNKWNPKIETEQEALFFLNKIVAKKVEQYITSLLKYSDPIFEMIHLQLIYQIKKHSFAKIKYLGTVFITENNCIALTGRILNSHDLQNYSSLILKYITNPFEPMFELLKKEGIFFPAIPLNALVLIIKEFETKENQIKFCSDITKELELEEGIATALSEAFSKLKISYLLKNKINEAEAISIEKALKDITLDLCDGGVSSELYEYLKNHFPGLSKQEYKEKYQNIFEYLYKILRTAIAQKISQ